MGKLEKNENFISIIIPCRHEGGFIGKCLDSILGQDYPKENLEVLIVDGMSEDETREIVKNYSSKFSFIKLLDNPDKLTPFGLNVGLKEAKGEIIVRMDAHADYGSDYISKCVKYLKEYDADNVGGIMKTLSRKDAVIAKAIAICLSHPFGAGGSYFRTGSKKIRWVDTVFGGCYKREVFDRIGLFNENLIRSQDIEFNLRLKRAGGKVLLVPEIISCYYPKAITLKDFFVYNFKNGFWAIYSFKFTKTSLRLRHYISLIFVLGLLLAGFFSILSPFFFWLFIFVFLFYFLFNLYFSAKIAKREKNLKYIFIMPIAFMARHIGYGLGSIFGVIKLFKR